MKDLTDFTIYPINNELAESEALLIRSKAVL